MEFEQSIVSGLGTVCVKGSDDLEEGFSTAQGGSGRPVLVRGGNKPPVNCALYTWKPVFGEKYLKLVWGEFAKAVKGLKRSLYHYAVLQSVCFDKNMFYFDKNIFFFFFYTCVESRAAKFFVVVVFFLYHVAWLSLLASFLEANDSRGSRGERNLCPFVVVISRIDTR